MARNAKWIGSNEPTGLSSRGGRDPLRPFLYVVAPVMEKLAESALHFDLETTSPLEMLTSLRRSNGVAVSSVNITSARGQDFIGCGFRVITETVVQGSIGDFGFCSFGVGECKVSGNVGDFFGHSIASGILIVRGNAMNSVGALGAGGLIAIYGDAGDRAAVGMQGTDVVIRGSVGSLAGLGMQRGTLIVGGAAGCNLGKGLRGGTIYIRGEAESISCDVEEQRLREPDRLKIGMLMLKSNIKSTGKEFRVFRSTHTET